MTDDNEHEWIGEFCRHCNVCRRECPPGAVRKEAVVHGDGRTTFIDNEKCFPYFAAHQGCSVCIQVCPFNNQEYSDLRKRYQRLTKWGYWEAGEQSS